MTLTVHDWRRMPGAVVIAALRTETARWRSDFAWDVDEAWQVIEPARLAGRFPGFMATDSRGRVVGWTCFVLHHRALQVAVFTAETPAVTEALVDAIATTPEASAASLHAWCVRDGAPALREVLSARGFEAVTYRYLSATPRRLPTAPLEHQRIRSWRTDDLGPLVRLCKRAYSDRRQVRAFAPLGTDVEWRDYLAGLVSGPGCGRLIPTASLVIDGRGPGRIDGAIVATDLGCGTAHIAQLVVEPDAACQGLGAALVRGALGRMAALGFVRVTLTVSSANERAGRLYRRFGFAHRAGFLVALNRQPRRLTSVALATGGANTRR
jgi:ribosomal protein S18 acetylase RimI-like enzyme